MNKLSVKLAKVLLDALGFEEETGLQIFKDTGLLHCCQKDGCFKRYYGKGLCKSHYAKKYRRQQGW